MHITFLCFILSEAYPELSIFAVADPGFPREHQALILKRKPIIWQDVYRELHRNVGN